MIYDEDLVAEIAWKYSLLIEEMGKIRKRGCSTGEDRALQFSDTYTTLRRLDKLVSPDLRRRLEIEGLEKEFLKLSIDELVGFLMQK